APWHRAGENWSGYLPQGRGSPLHRRGQQAGRGMGEQGDAGNAGWLTRGRYRSTATGKTQLADDLKPKNPRWITPTGDFFIHYLRYTSRLDTASALRSMNSRRGSTWSPIRVLKIWSAPMASSMVTCNIRRFSGSMVVSHSWSAFI